MNSLRWPNRAMCTVGGANIGGRANKDGALTVKRKESGNNQERSYSGRNVFDSNRTSYNRFAAYRVGERDVVHRLRFPSQLQRECPLGGGR